MEPPRKLLDFESLGFVICKVGLVALGLPNRQTKLRASGTRRAGVCKEAKQSGRHFSVSNRGGHSQQGQVRLSDTSLCLF